MITCPKCSKDNQDHYKFCLGCGAELPRDAAPKPFSPQTPSHGVKAAGAARSARRRTPPAAPAAAARARPPAAAAAAGPRGGGVAAGASAAPAGRRPASALRRRPAPSSCPQCGHINTPTNLFCGSCGFRLGGAAAARRRPRRPRARVAAAPARHRRPHRAPRRRQRGRHVHAPRHGTVTVGRETGAIFAGDSYLSPRHATFTRGAGRSPSRTRPRSTASTRSSFATCPSSSARTTSSASGRRSSASSRSQPARPRADGVERLGCPSKGYVGRIALVIGRDATGNAFPIPETGIHLGRERGDVLFPEDGYVSGLHCRLALGGRPPSSPTSAARTAPSCASTRRPRSRRGDVLLMGQQLFRVAM